MGFSTGYASYIVAVIYLATVLVPVGMVVWGTQRSDKFVLRCILCTAVMIAVMELFTFGVQFIWVYRPKLQKYIIYIQLVKFFVIYLLSGIAVKICFQCDWWGALFCATAGYCLQHISARIDSICEEFILPEMHWSLTTLISMVIAAAVFTCFYFLVLRRKNRKTWLNVENKWQVVIAACVVGVTIFYNSFGISYLSGIKMTMENEGLDVSHVNYSLLFVYVMSMLTAVLALALDLGMSKNKQLSGEMEELNRIINEGKRQYEYEKTNIEMINVKCHDLKHQLAAMKGKIYEEQIEELTNVINIYDSSVKTGNEALDVVLTQKNFYCGQHGIRLTCLLNGKNYDIIPRHELYAVFNNAIDNAIEAVEKIEEEKRVISVTESVSGDLVTVRVENYFAGELELNEGLPVSGKSGEGHGFGVKSIKMIAEKYGGGISVSRENDKFVLDIFFQK